MSGTPKIVIDASVLVKWFVQEEGSQDALKVRDKYLKAELLLIAPHLLPFEALNALLHKSLFTNEELQLASEAIGAYGIRLYDLEGEYSKKTTDIAYEAGITIYDASYLALAVMEKATLYTFDRTLGESLKTQYADSVKTPAELPT